MTKVRSFICGIKGTKLSKNEIAMDIIPPLPLNVLVANTQGAIGYMIQQSLQNALYKEESNREVVTFISQVKVDKSDSNISNPSKFIGFRFGPDATPVLKSSIFIFFSPNLPTH